MDNVFFCNSGCEANEAAIKLARLYGHVKGIEQPTIVVMEKAFHGRTLATLSATGSRKVQAGFEPLLAGFVRVPYNDVQTLEQVAIHNKNIVAVMVEPIQGEGGINIPDDGYLPYLRTACDRHGWLLMLDEVQSGIGRTGQWFAHQLYGVKPDVMTLAKGLGNGIAIGACLAAGAAAKVFHPGNHGSTFGGNPLACVAAHATLSIIADERLMDNAVRIGEQIRTGLRERLSTVSHVREVRGCGLMVGVDLTRPCASLVQKGLERGVLINVTADTVLRLLPPLIMQPGEATQLIDAVSELVEQFVAEAVPAGVNG
jgi:acetylornithine/N-succinyldiaminopimelate aminotransferase